MTIERVPQKLNREQEDWMEPLPDDMPSTYSEEVTKLLDYWAFRNWTVMQLIRFFEGKVEEAKAKAIKE